MKGGVLLLTGVPGAGKTTVLRRVNDLLAGRRLRGFLTGPPGSPAWACARLIGSAGTASIWMRSTRSPSRRSRPRSVPFWESGLKFLVEHAGIEPATSAMPLRRSPS